MVAVALLFDPVAAAGSDDTGTSLIAKKPSVIVDSAVRHPVVIGDSTADSLRRAHAPAAKSADTALHGDTATVPPRPAIAHAVPLPPGPAVVSGEKAPTPAIKSVAPSRKLPRLFRVGRQLRRHGGSILALLMLGGAALIVVALVKGNRESRRLISTARLGIMDTEVQKACLLMERFFADPALTADEVCRRLTSNRAYMESLFQRELGMTVDGFILQVRINRAKIFLTHEPSLPLEALAQRTGFVSGAELAAGFKKITGTGIDDMRKAVSTGTA